MQIHTDIDIPLNIRNPVLTVGTFDGVHLGHTKILEKLKKAAEEIKGESVLLTFDPHPRFVLFPEDNDLKLLNTLEEKKELLMKTGIGHLIIFPFTREFSRLSSVEFIRDIVVNRIKTKKLIIGYNHHFGRNREGSFAHLKEYGPVYGFEVDEIPAQDVDRVEISSTKVRQELQKGNVARAARYLGYNYFLSGKVVKGHGRGREIGFRTANIRVGSPEKLIPANGVYTVKAEISGTIFGGMLNIGNQPTFNGISTSIELNIFNFEKDIYNETLRVFFIERLRDERKFGRATELGKQLKKDKEKSLKILSLK